VPISAPVNIGINASNTTQTYSVTVPVGGVPSGALIGVSVVSVASTLTGSSVSDTAGNTYHLADSAAFNSSGEKLYQFYAYNCLALVQNNTISVNQGSGVSGAMSCWYATGVKTSADPWDSTASTSGGASGSSTSPSAAMRAAPASASSLVIGCVAAVISHSATFTQDSTNASYATPPNRSTQGSGIHPEVAGGSVISSSQLTYAPTYGSSATWGEIVCVFSPPAAAAAACGSLALLGVGCAIALAKKIEENSVLSRRSILVL
jgi:hypothetical protein